MASSNATDTADGTQERAATLQVAAVQATPAFLDRARTMAIVAAEVVAASANGAELVVFPESFVPGYPDWVWRRPPMSDGDWYARFAAQAVDVEGPDLDIVREAARDAGTWVALGITERLPSGTLNNSLVYIDAAGEISDAASTTLADARRESRRLSVEIQDRAERFLRDAETV